MKSQFLKGRRLAAALLILLIIIASIWLGLKQVNLLISPVNPGDKRPVEVEIPVNSSTRQVARILADKGLIRSAGFFAAWCRIKGLDGRLQAGYYSLNRGQGMNEILDYLIEGRTASLRITVPEGYNLSQIEELLVSRGICTHSEWQEALNKDYRFFYMDNLPRNDRRLEGFLFPDTYQVRKGASAEEIIQMMLTRFEEVWQKEFAAEARARGLTVNQVVTMASLVEKEARVASERPRIAGVLYNRLKLGMPLQVDATILYSLGRHKERVTYKDLEVDSPYNTYLHTGLPPGPIAMPGAASLRAALWPEQNSYLYYVVAEGGKHYFSKTYEEHLAAKNRYRKVD